MIAKVLPHRKFGWCVFIILLLPHLWRVHVLEHFKKKKKKPGSDQNRSIGTRIDSWISKEKFVMHLCTGGLLHPYPRPHFSDRHYSMHSCRICVSVI